MNTNVRILIICLAVSMAVLLEGIVPNPVEAAVGQSCTTSNDCPQPSTCHKGFCTGPCKLNAACQGVIFRNNVGWLNGVCTSDGVKDGVCVEAPLQVIPTGPQTGKALLTLVEAATNWFFVFFLITATIFIILAGLQFVTGRGDPVSISQARMKLIFAVIAIVIASLARGIPVVIRAIVGG